MNPAEIMAHCLPASGAVTILKQRGPGCGAGRILGAKAEAIVKAVADRRRDVSVKELKAKGAVHRIAHARHEAMYELYATGDYSYPTIGAYFGCDHTTVMHGVRAHEARLIAAAEKAAA